MLQPKETSVILPKVAKNKSRDEILWYAVYTKSRCEKKMVQYLASLGIESYVPIRKEKHKWSDRMKVVEVPIIHSYCFVHINDRTQHNVMYDAPGFISFVCHNRELIVIPEREMELMKQTVDSMLAVEIENRLLRKGKKVRIQTGPMAGAVGIVEDLTDKRVNILLEAVGITMVVKLNDDVLFETVHDEEDDEEGEN